MTPIALKATDPDTLAAWFAGKAPRRLLAIPFGGPIPGPGGTTRDLEGEYFDARTDIKPDWFEARPVLFQHGQDPLGKAGTGIVGKATNLGAADGTPGTPDVEGWWVDIWMMAGERNAARVKALAERGAQLFGSSGAFPHLVRKGKAGHIEVWPYIEQTITTTPVNPLSGFRSTKAMLDDFTTAQITVSDVLRDVFTELDALRDLRPDLVPGDGAAKAGRELSGAEQDEWTEVLAGIVARADELRKRVQARYQSAED